MSQLRSNPPEAIYATWYFDNLDFVGHGNVVTLTIALVAMGYSLTPNMLLQYAKVENPSLYAELVANPRVNSFLVELAKKARASEGE